MARTAIKKTAAKKSAVSSETKSSVSKKPIIKKSESNIINEASLQDRLNSFLSSVKSKRNTSSSDSKIGPVRRKYLLPIIGLVVVLGLLYIASRYLVVAWVDKKPITRFDYYSQLDKKYGHDMREQMIVQALIDSEASQRHVTVSDQDISNEITKIETEQGGSSNLDQVLQQQGISRDELKNLVRLQLLRSKMFGDQANVTDAEINQYITDNKDQLPQTDPKDASAQANLRENVKQQLMQQKINATFSSWLQGNVDSDRVIRL